MGDELKGPDGKALPGAKDIPPKKDRKLNKPGGATVAGAGEAVEADMKSHGSDKEREIEVPFPPPPDRKVTAKWTRLGETFWKFTIGAMTVTVERTDEGTRQYAVEPPPKPRRALAQAIFSASGSCKDVVWVQYKEVKDTLYDGNTEVPQSKPQPPAGLDGGVPYPFQEQDASGGATMSDQPALPPGYPASATDGEVASSEVKKIGEREAPGKKVTKVVRAVTLWSYAICVDPYQVIGHYKWGYTVTLDPGNTAEPIKVDRTTPNWTKGK